MGDCETGGPHNVEEFTDGELRCVECCRAWAPLELAWKLQGALKSIAANTCCDKCQEAARVARRALEEGLMGALTETDERLVRGVEESDSMPGASDWEVDLAALVRRLAQHSDALGSRCERYLSALQKVRAAITENATDTIWLRSEDATNMTAVECIDAALRAPTAPREAAKK